MGVFPKVVAAFTFFSANGTVRFVRSDGTWAEYAEGPGKWTELPPCPMQPPAAPEPPVIVADGWECLECDETPENYAYQPPYRNPAMDTRCGRCGSPRPATQGTR